MAVLTHGKSRHCFPMPSTLLRRGLRLGKTHSAIAVAPTADMFPTCTRSRTHRPMSGTERPVPCTLYGIPASHYVEKVRWALDMSRVPYAEVGLLPLLHFRHTLPRGGRTVPMLVGGGGPENVLTDSTDILAWLAEDANATWLYPKGRGDHASSLEADLDARLGPHTRRWAYWQLFRPDAASGLAHRVLTNHVNNVDPCGRGRVGAFLAAACLPLIRQGILYSLNVNAASAARSLGRVEGIFAETDALLSDGRPWLCGPSFTAADLTLASLAALVILPPSSAGWRTGEVISPESLHAESQAVVARLRATPTGRHVMKCFEEKRQGNQRQGNQQHGEKEG